MLDIICADACCDKLSAMAEKIEFSLNAGRRVMVIVPDQFSFEYDKALYQRLGVKQFNKLITGGFMRICELIGRKHGGYAGENADRNLSVIMMYMAIKRLRREGSALYYKKAFEKGSFIGKMISLIKELRSSGITPEQLSLAANKENGSTLSKKLSDISKLYSYYMQELESRGLHDNSYGVARAVELSLQYGSFDGMDIFIDSFHSFSRDELSLIRIMISQAKNVTVGLMIGSGANSSSPLTPFAEPLRTKTQLEDMARELSVKVRYLTAPAYDDISPEIALINDRLFLSSKKQLDKSENVTIIKCSDIYEEAEFVSSQIISLMRKEGLSFDDFAVLIRDPAANRSALSAVFDRYDIPVFFDCPELITQYSFVMYFDGLFNCVLSKKYNTENILRCIRSPLSDFYEYESSMLEDYCTAWNVEGDMWLDDFTAKDKSIKDGDGYLKIVNDLRRKIIEPLNDFKSSCVDATAKQISTALYELLKKIKLSEKSYSMIKVSSEGDEDMKIYARQFRQLWELSVSCISAVYQNIPDEKLSLRRYYELLRTMFADITISAPPQKLDTVIVADPSHSRLTSKRAVFVMCCNDGVFPSEEKNEGLITDREKQVLEDNGIELPGGMKNRLAHERLVCYSALTLSTQRLYTLWHETDSKGNRSRRSAVLSSVDSMLGSYTEIRAQDKPIEFYCPTYRSAYTKYLEHCHDRSSLSASLRAALESNDKYAQKIADLHNTAAGKPFSLDKRYAKELFCNKDMNLSATRLEAYYKCPFMYFCKYGLKITPPSGNKADPKNRGSFVHSCLEHILSKQLPDGSVVFDKDFKDLTDDQLKKRIHNHFISYLDAELGGSFGKTKRFDFLAKRWEESAFYVVKNLREELLNSLFQPVGFEYKLERKDGGSLLRIEVPGKYAINVFGSIDRVDMLEYTDENGKPQKYLRIIDYKTGFKELKLEELYNGLNLQMLIYLLALTQGENDIDPDGNAKPSGVLYMPAVHVNADDTSDKAYKKGLSGDLEKSLAEYRDNKYKRFGLIIDNEITTKAMDTLGGRFIKLSRDKKTNEVNKLGSTVVLSKEELEAFEEFAKAKLIGMAESLYEGKIEAEPLYTIETAANDKGTPCSWCDYKSVCRNAFTKHHRTVNKEKDKTKMLEALKPKEEGEGSNAD